MNVAALMPVKGFRNAKQRLNPLLNSAGARALGGNHVSATFYAK